MSYLNQIDSSYRLELRELNGLNFARFDAKLVQRVAELRSDFKRELTALDLRWERRIAQLDARWERRFAELDSKIEQPTSPPRGETVTEFTSCSAGLIKWMFLCWAGTAVAMVGTWIALGKL